MFYSDSDGKIDDAIESIFPQVSARKCFVHISRHLRELGHTYISSQNICHLKHLLADLCSTSDANVFESRLSDIVEQFGSRDGPPTDAVRAALAH